MGPHSCSQLSCWISDTDLAEGFSNTVASLQTQGFLTRNWSSRSGGGWQMLPSPPHTKSLGSEDPRAWAPLGSGQKVASVGTVGPPESSKIILSATPHFPRKRASIAQIHPIFCKKAFDFTPSGPFLRVGVPPYTPQGLPCGCSCPCWGWERHQGRGACRTGQ